ncbi:uncharacterized protein LTHEOB_7736 [Neofusicoccum parvum]|nr:uncharacterized protein LTHEOB_7736 [Neofusicoccum parvum]
MDITEVTQDVNAISTFISREDIPDISKAEPVDCIILCVCSVLHSAETVFTALQARPGLTKTLVLCGGIGHSTRYIYEAVAQHPKFKEIAADVQGLPEAQVLHVLFNRFFASPSLTASGPRILLEDRSTTCATNATEARRLLESHGIAAPTSVLVVQDPTMSRRTVACFDKVYSDVFNPPRFVGCPIFVPLVRPGRDGELAYDVPAVDPDSMWNTDRFLELVMGEVPRLRDDERGYGPSGKGHIVHVDIPLDVERAWTRLHSAIPHRRY